PVELLELGDPDRGADVVEAVVVAESRVLEPAAAVGAPLVAEALQQPPLRLVMGRDDSALPCRHLLVRIEREDGGRAVRANRRAAVVGAERLACVLDQREAVAFAEL